MDKNQHLPASDQAVKVKMVTIAEAKRRWDLSYYWDDISNWPVFTWPEPLPEKKYKCPKCGGERFGATAHVTQDWELDAWGQFSRSLGDCVETTHYPNEDDVWDCAQCHFNGAGALFKTELLKS
jgi:ribosomal protein L37AE/L43A